MRSQKSYMRPGTVSKMTAGAASTQSSAFGAQTTVVRIASADNAFHFVLGANPTATTNHSICPGAWAEYILVKPGEKLAVIRTGLADANVTVTEMDA